MRQAPHPTPPGPSSFFPVLNLRRHGLLVQRPTKLRADLRFHLLQLVPEIRLIPLDRVLDHRHHSTVPVLINSVLHIDDLTPIRIGQLQIRLHLVDVMLLRSVLYVLHAPAVVLKS